MSSLGCYDQLGIYGFQASAPGLLQSSFFSGFAGLLGKCAEFWWSFAGRVSTRCLGVEQACPLPGSAPKAAAGLKVEVVKLQGCYNFFQAGAEIVGLGFGGCACRDIKDPRGMVLVMIQATCAKPYDARYRNPYHNLLKGTR